MKKFGKFCGITALILIILGIVLVVGGFATGASLVALRNDFYEAGDYEYKDIFSFWKNPFWKNLNKRHSGSGSKSTSSDTFSADKDISSITVDIQYGDVKIYNGDEDGKKLEDGEILVEKKICEDLQTIEVSAAYGTLNIIEDYSGLDSLNNVDYWNDQGGEIKIYVAEGVTLDKVSIVNGAGDISIDRDLDIRELSVDMGAGDFSSDGSIQVSERMNITNGMGDIDLESVTCQGDAYIQTNAGDVNMQAEVSGDLSITNGAGDVNMQGKVSGNLNISNGTGDIGILLTGEMEHYNYDISTGVGDVKVNGQKYEGIGQEVVQNYNPGGSTITVENGAGDIELDIN